MSRKFEYVNRIISSGYEFKEIKFDLPKRSTKNSAGYDFINPENVILEPGELKYVKTGVKAYMQDDEFLMLCNRSSNPKKKGLVLINGVGIVDSDYYGNEENDGEIAFAFKNISNEAVRIEAGEKLGQGIFIKYGIVENDETAAVRNGGFGSTGK